jgi:type II secretory pathway pseudopilin PulG
VKKSFTLIELTLVIGIIVILASTLIPRVSRSLEKSRNARRMSDIQTLTLALETFYEDSGRYPNNANDNIENTGECIGARGVANDSVCTGGAITSTVSNNFSDIDRVLRPYIKGNVPGDPSYRANNNANDDFYYAYDPSHTVDWCDADNANNVTAPVLGYRREEPERAAADKRRDTCTDNQMQLDQADYNVAFTSP